MRIYRSFYLLLFFFLLGCENTGHTSNKTMPKAFIDHKKEAEFRDEKAADYDMTYSKGIVVATVGDKVSEHLLIYNKTGDVWRALAFEGDLNKNLLEVQPLAKDPDTYLLAFNCIGITDKYYKIIVNENSKEAKYVKIEDTVFQLQTWQEYILSCFSLDFNPVSNPIRTSFSENAKILLYDKDEFYHAVKFHGDWVQIKWGDETNWHYGWVKWRRNKILIITLFNNG
ncbi:hypothetical protein [Mucilaginibacter segetis]|uniref:Lipoprotein n=1 Tax=Mucilaginibacter segetis TaxID=2793071 RepID=A0A934UM38_9SPHI|nr:hypothetical protein [Mucilaginibacter segetis]MBK0378472.1 hypothetical protein [Mucilaginibacter segetis]